MQELLPILIGTMLGSLVCAAGWRPRSGHLLVLGAIAGAASTTINGEWGAGAAPFLIDTISVTFYAGTILVARAGLRRLRHKPLSTSDCT
jgi:hypothetical protein